MTDFPPPKLESCIECGRPFACGACDGGACWCAAVPVKLPVSGDRCLCPECLNAKIAALVAVPNICQSAATDSSTAKSSHQ